MKIVDVELYAKDGIEYLKIKEKAKGSLRFNYVETLYWVKQKNSRQTKKIYNYIKKHKPELLI